VGQGVGPGQGGKVIVGFKEYRRETAELLLGCYGNKSIGRQVHHSTGLTIKLYINDKQLILGIQLDACDHVICSSCLVQGFPKLKSYSNVSKIPYIF
jgi:hypothetical protein